jgi:transposase InsO family protein
VPYTIHIVLTDNGIQFGDMPSRRTGPTARYRLHMFGRICREQGIEHRKPNHPWTNGQVERMNRTLKEATVRRYHYETHRQSLGRPAQPIQIRSNPPHFGTEHLGQPPEGLDRLGQCQWAWISLQWSSKSLRN